jgi:hypothetical protein
MRVTAWWRPRLIALLAAGALALGVLALGMGMALGIHLTITHITKLHLLRPTALNRPSFPHSLALGWRIIRAPTPIGSTPEHRRKADEARSVLGFDPGVIGPLSGIRRHDWEAEHDIPRAQKALRSAVVARLGHKLDYVAAPSVRIHSTQPLDGGIRRVVFSVPGEPGYRIKGCMLLPPGEAPHPAVILAYGAGGTFLDTCGWSVEGYHNDMGLRLAREGYVSIVYSLRGLGHDSHDWGRPEWEPLTYPNLVGYSLLRGSCAMNIWVYDGLQVLTAMASHPRVTPDEIMFGGVSHGGQIAMFAGAIDERVRGVVSMGSFASFEGLFTETHLWTGHAIPGIGAVADIGDIAALVAPRPLLVQWGEKEHMKERGLGGMLRPSSLAEFERAQRVYERLGAGRNIRKVITPALGHHFDTDAARDFLAAHLENPDWPTFTSRN